MQKQIVSRIEELGGRVLKARSETLRAHIDAIRFPHVLYDNNWGMYGIDKFYDKNRKSFESTPAKFYKAIEAAYFTDDDKPRGQSFWRTKHFTPMTPGTDDFDEWSSHFDNPEFVNLQSVREVVGEGKLEFMQIMYAYGCPDHFYVCLQDPKPANPTVFGTDHEMFFREFSVTEPFSQFLKRFLTRADFLKIVKEYLADKAAAG